MKRTRTVELAWAAGFFDGEGSIVCRLRPAKRGSSLRLQIGQIDRRPLDRFVDAVGAGYVYGPREYPSRPNRHPLWVYQCGKVNDILAVLDALWPFLSEPKKEQAERVLDMWENRPLSRKSPLVAGRR